MVNDSSISLKMRAVVLTIVILSCEGRMNPSSIMLPNIGTDAAYEVTSPLFDESVKRSILYYTITFSAAGLFVLFCITWITAAQYFKARKALKAVIIPYDDEEVLDDDDESDEDNDDTEKVEENLKPPVIMADCSSQYEDLVRQEADILTWKKKLRVKRRKLISTQPLTAYPGTGIGRSLQYSMNLPDDNTFDASFQQSPPTRYVTPMKGASLEVINYQERIKLKPTPYDTYPLLVDTPIKEVNDMNTTTQKAETAHTNFDYEETKK